MSEDSIFDSIPKNISAKTKTINIITTLKKAGFWWRDDRLKPLYSEIDELREELEKETIDKEKLSSEIGDILLILTDIANTHGIDTEEALSQTNDRVEKRFRHVEQGLKNNNNSFAKASTEDVLTFWREAKKLEKQN